MTNPRPTIYEYAGGAPAFLRLTQTFYGKVMADPLLKPVFIDFTDEHVRLVALWLGEVFSGPSAYSDIRGGHNTILAAHSGKHLTQAQRDRWVELMTETAHEVLPDNEIFQERFCSYIEWGADIAMRASQSDEPPTSTQPVPKWDWEPGALPNS